MTQATIVSAFLKSSNERKDRDTEKYIAYGKKLLDCDIQIVLFMDETLINDFQTIYNKPNIYIIPFKREDIYLYEKQYKDQITAFDISTDFSEKDTLDYMLLICNKTEFVRQAIEINPFSSEQFVWVDFGINHIFPQDDLLFFRECIQNTFLDDTDFQSVRIGNIWSPYINYLHDPEDIYKKIAWYFAGGVFGGPKDKLLEFASLTKNKCIQVICEKNSIMWEVNIWYLVFKENPELFSPYLCDHNSSLVVNYNNVPVLLPISQRM